MNTRLPDDAKSSFLLGIFTALNLSNKVTEAEAQLVIQFIRNNRELLDAPILAPSRKKLEAILERTEIWRADCNVIKDLVFGCLGVSPGSDSERLDAIPFDSITDIDFEGSVFVVTGQFAIGRGFVEARIEEMGGELRGSCSKLVRYLIVGSIPDAAWKFGNYGTKVRKAVDLKGAGREIEIVDEATFTRLIPATGD